MSLPPKKSIGPEDEGIHPVTYALSAWLYNAIHRLRMVPKAVYLEIGVDQSTFSRWTSLEHDQSIPSYHIPAVLDLLDEQAEVDLRAILRPTKRKGQ